MRLNRRHSDPLHPQCPQCQAQANVTLHTVKSKAYPYRGVWAIDTRTNTTAHCPACAHEWTVRVSGTGQELGRREEGPFFDVTTFQQISPANLHLLEIAFDLGKADEATPNAWSFVQMMLETSLFFYPSDSLLKSLRELAVEVEEGDDGPLYPYEFQVTPTDWDPLDEQPSPQITVSCLAGEDTCDRAWLLARLQTLLATFAQTHGEASAAQFQTLINVGNETLKWRPDRVTREPAQSWGEDPVGCAISVFIGISLVVGGSLGLIGFFALDIFLFPFIAIALSLVWIVISTLWRFD